MPSAKRTIEIERPIGEVFAFFSDPANDQRWRPHVVEIVAEGPAGEGRRIHQVVGGPFGRGIPADIVVTAWEPDAHYAFEVTAGPARPHGDFRFRALGPERTEATFALDATLGGLRGLILSRPVQASMDGEMAALDRAKAVIEGGASGAF